MVFDTRRAASYNRHENSGGRCARPFAVSQVHAERNTCSLGYDRLQKRTQ